MPKLKLKGMVSPADLEGVLEEIRNYGTAESPNENRRIPFEGEVPLNTEDDIHTTSELLETLRGCYYDVQVECDIINAIE